jgi:deoxyadenosine/deoxycytidine kinase
MVRTVNLELLNNTHIQQKPSLIVELVGPAGAGKTTVAQALRQRDQKIQIAADLKLRKMAHITTFVGYAPFLLPTLLRGSSAGRWFTWDEMKAMVYLRGWPRLLRQEALHGGPAILLDHGPVFKLATLNAFGPDKLKSQGFEPWWDGMFRQWASTLDIVVWLDATNTNLVERINRRGQRHAVKGKPEQEASQYLARYRMAYEQILGQLAAYGRPILLQFDTSQVSIEQIVNEVYARIYSY